MSPGKSFLLFMILSLVLAAVSTQQTSPPDPLAKLTYTCDGNGTYWLNFSVVASNVSYIISNGNTTDGPMYGKNSTNCTTQLLNTKNASSIALGNCTENPILYVMINRTGPLSKLIGGESFHEYELECKLPTGGVTFSVNKTFGVTPEPPTTKIQNPIVNLTMDFKEANNTTISKSKFLLNEKMILDIHDYSAVSHELKLLTCDAYPSNSLKDSRTTIYDGKNKTNDIVGSVAEERRDIKVELRAFRFVSSSTTFIQCTVLVCNANETCSATTRRRRAAAEDLDTVSTVEGSFSIVQPDKPKRPVSSGQATVKPWCASFISAIALVVSVYVTM